MKLELELSDAQLEAIAEKVAEINAAREPAEPRLLDTRGAAEYLSIHPVTLRKWAAEGRVEFEQEEKGCKMFFSTRVLDRHRRGGVR